jgi:hypothetical protein
VILAARWRVSYVSGERKTTNGDSAAAGGPGGRSRPGGVPIDVGGGYRLGKLAAGTYTIVFNRTNCGLNHGFLPLTRTVRIRAGHAVKGFDAFLKHGATIAGKITNGTGASVRFCAEVINASSGAPVRGALAGTEGRYLIDTLPAGTYIVQFFGGAQCQFAGNYAPQFYPGQANQGSAERLKVVAGQAVTGINAVLQPGATITGKVTDTSGQPADGQCVKVYPVSDGWVIPDLYQGIGVTTVNGKYTLASLPAGLYLVQFGCSDDGPPPGQWAAGQLSVTAADYVSAPGGAVTVVNAALSQDGTVTGKVTDAAGHLVKNACVLAIPHGSPFPLLAGPYPLLHQDPDASAPGAGLLIGNPAPAVTNAKGQYSIGGLLPGSYDVQFSDCGARTLAGQWYHGGLTQKSATQVQVSAGAATTGIDAVLLAGGTISGRVGNGADHGAIGQCVTAHDINGQFFGAAEVGHLGRYAITGLPSGSYQVSTYLQSCEQVPPVAGAGARAPVTVTAPGAVAGVNFTVRTTGTITGTVGSPAGRPLDGICVLAAPVGPGGPALGLSGYSTNFGFEADRPAGTYEISGLAPGTYRLVFDDPGCLVQGLTQDDSYAPSTSAVVTVTAGGTTSRIDARLMPRGHITGTVTDAGGSPVQYKIQFSADSCGATGFAAQWWQNAPSQATATVVTITPGAAVAGIDAALTS